MKAFAALFALIGLFATSYFSMVYAWGLEVKSWPALIAGYVALFGFQVIASALGKGD
ncbi:hypothetical protein [Chromobacterium rhizoryzae]|uniref:hypothetical protein n=1 Tax=Chromobacterium rhizoryzae TaxID=1778675 RepID=UPI001D0903B7|nr:hypothetical protein [Chromobacterium rhizoryzae]